MSFFFNVEYEKYLEQNKSDPYHSNKISQEFEYLINYLDPTSEIYTTKNYSKDFLDKFKELTGVSFKMTHRKKVVIPWCQDSSDFSMLQKLQDKKKTLTFFKEKGVIKHHLELINNKEKLEEGFLYKEPFSLSGMGHYSYPKDKIKIENLLLEKELIKEERLDRKIDFSTLVKNGKVLGRYQNFVDDHFQYKGTIISKDFKLEDHLEEPYHKALQIILAYSKDYSGIMSIDSFTYQKNNELYLQPISEINARKTMGYCALKMKEKYFPKFNHFLFFLKRNDNSLINRMMISPIENRFHIYTVGAQSLSELKFIKEQFNFD